MNITVLTDDDISIEGRCKELIIGAFRKNYTEIVCNATIYTILKWTKDDDSIVLIVQQEDFYGN